MSLFRVECLTVDRLEAVGDLNGPGERCGPVWCVFFFVFLRFLLRLRVQDLGLGLGFVVWGSRFGVWG